MAPEHVEQLHHAAAGVDLPARHRVGSRAGQPNQLRRRDAVESGAAEQRSEDVTRLVHLHRDGPVRQHLPQRVHRAAVLDRAAGVRVR